VTEPVEPTDSSAETALIAALDPFSTFWRTFEAWAEARRAAIGIGLLRAGSDSVETARGKAAMLQEIVRFGEEKREALKTKGDLTHDD